MIYDLLAKIVLFFHLLFIVFVVFGGLLVFFWRRAAWAHVPAVAWGVFIEYAGWICPLTPLENVLRAKANLLGYEGGFIEHLLMPVIYPLQLTPQCQMILGATVLVVNGCLYGFLWQSVRRNEK